MKPQPQIQEKYTLYTCATLYEKCIVKNKFIITNSTRKCLVLNNVLEIVYALSEVLVII